MEVHAKPNVHKFTEDHENDHTNIFNICLSNKTKPPFKLTQIVNDHSVSFEIDSAVIRVSALLSVDPFLLTSLVRKSSENS